MQDQSPEAIWKEQWSDRLFLLQIVWTYSEYIGMKFGIDMCAMLELARGRLVRSEGMEFSDRKRIKEVDQEGYKYLGVLQQ